MYTSQPLTVRVLGCCILAALNLAWAERAENDEAAFDARTINLEIQQLGLQQRVGLQAIQDALHTAHLSPQSHHALGAELLEVQRQLEAQDIAEAEGEHSALVDADDALSAELAVLLQDMRMKCSTTRTEGNGRERDAGGDLTSPQAAAMVHIKECLDARKAVSDQRFQLTKHRRKTAADYKETLLGTSHTLQTLREGTIKQQRSFEDDMQAATVKLLVKTGSLRDAAKSLGEDD